MADASVERRAAAEALLVRGTRALQAACLDAWRRGTVQRAAAQRALQAVLLKMLAAKESQVRPAHAPCPAPSALRAAIHERMTQSWCNL